MFYYGYNKFQLTRLMRGVTFEKFVGNAERIFQLTRLMRGVTGYKKVLALFACRFQLTRLMRGVTQNIYSTTPIAHNFNSHASCEA